MRRANIVCYSASLGLVRDVKLLARTLTRAGHLVTVNNYEYPVASGLRRVVSRSVTVAMKSFRHGVLRRPFFDVNLFLERVTPRSLPLARANCFPNPKWLKDEDHGHLTDINLVLCKTRYTAEIFSRLGCATEYTSFTSEDRSVLEGMDRSDTFFHLAGSSLQKGNAGRG